MFSRDGAVEQFDVLRQIADVLPERFGRPLIERRAVEPDVAARRAATRRPARAPAKIFPTARPDDAEPAAGLQRES